MSILEAIQDASGGGTGPGSCPGVGHHNGPGISAAERMRKRDEKA